MKKALVLIFFSLVSLSCEHPAIYEGRAAYKRYFKEQLQDPESLKIYSEKATRFSYEKAVFEVDYGAKNGFGAYVRKNVKFETKGSNYLKVNGEYYIFKD